MIVEDTRAAAAATLIAPSPGTARAVRAGLREYVELAKLRISALVLLTTATGYLMAGGASAGRLLLTVLGTALAAVGANTINQILEIAPDSRMERTRTRPLVEGRISRRAAAAFAASTALAGLALLLTVGAATALAGLFTIVAYSFVYTPLKRRTPWCTLVGAVPGALPPVMGALAARPVPGAEALALFSILFLWQMPHFYAIAWMYRRDYARGGFPMLAVLDPHGRRTGRQSIAFASLLALAAIMPYAAGKAGLGYLLTAAPLSIAFLLLVVAFAARPTRSSARAVFIGSIAWLPIVLLALATAWVR